ncbi:hypothetical protein [Lunatimonas salinarum]|uniref:hypothetical protein n=1 Tax=Lunatimonas salinarum TaxID=1774590 RepID=UPI001ADF314F|nr:hypothetical protein [Lunatimonas salinarum]
MISKIILPLISTLLFVLTLGIDGNTQTESKAFSAKNSVYLEVGGNAGWYSLNYGRIFYQKGILKLSASAGISMWPHNTSEQPYNTSKTNYLLPSIPLEFSAFLGNSKHHLEIGSGITPYLSVTVKRDPDFLSSTDKIYLGTYIPLRLGYRYQKPEGGFFFRIAYTPFYRFPKYSDETNNFSPIFAGISLGKSF